MLAIEQTIPKCNLQWKSKGREQGEKITKSKSKGGMHKELNRNAEGKSNQLQALWQDTQAVGQMGLRMRMRIRMKVGLKMPTGTMGLVMLTIMPTIIIMRRSARCYECTIHMVSSTWHPAHFFITADSNETLPGIVAQQRTLIWTAAANAQIYGAMDDVKSWSEWPCHGKVKKWSKWMPRMS